MELQNRIINIWHKSEKLRFLMIGGYNTVFAYAIFCLLQIFFSPKLHYLSLLAAAHIISVGNSFFTMRLFVFCSKGNLLNEYVRVNIVYLGYLAANALFLFILKDFFLVNVLLAQLICIIILTILVYFLHKHFSFKNTSISL